jgi:hypothetical protein
MKLISPTDSIFLLGESREHPMHVGGLGLYEAPDGVSGSDFLRELHQDMVAQQDFQPTFRKHPATVFGGTARCSTGTVRCGKPTLSKASTTAGSPCTSSSTTH